MLEYARPVDTIVPALQRYAGNEPSTMKRAGEVSKIR
jgi:hypothetical protein